MLGETTDQRAPARVDQACPTGTACLGAPRACAAWTASLDTAEAAAGGKKCLSQKGLSYSALIGLAGTFSRLASSPHCPNRVLSPSRTSSGNSEIAAGWPILGLVARTAKHMSVVSLLKHNRRARLQIPSLIGFALRRPHQNTALFPNVLTHLRRRILVILSCCLFVACLLLGGGTRRWFPFGFGPSITFNSCTCVCAPECGQEVPLFRK